MYQLTKKSVFKGHLNKVSPIDIVERISNKTSISIIAGNKDLTTPAALIRKYHSALIKAGKDAKFKMIEGDHGIFLNEDTLDEVYKVIMSDGKKLQRTSH